MVGGGGGGGGPGLLRSQPRGPTYLEPQIPWPVSVGTTDIIEIELKNLSRSRSVRLRISLRTYLGRDWQGWNGVCEGGAGGGGEGGKNRGNQGEGEGQDGGGGGWVEMVTIG